MFFDKTVLSTTLYDWIKWLGIDNLLVCFSSRKKKALIMYKEFMDIISDDKVLKFSSRKSRSSIFGDNGFVEMIKEKFVNSNKMSSLEIKEKRVVLGEGKVKVINAQICDRFNIEESQLYQTRRGVENLPRLFAISLSRGLSGLSFPEIAENIRLNHTKLLLQVIFD